MPLTFFPRSLELDGSRREDDCTLLKRLFKVLRPTVLLSWLIDATAGVDVILKPLSWWCCSSSESLSSAKLLHSSGRLLLRIWDFRVDGGGFWRLLLVIRLLDTCCWWEEWRGFVSSKLLDEAYPAATADDLVFRIILPKIISLNQISF
jgi:hypothetical protein